MNFKENYIFTNLTHKNKLNSMSQNYNSEFIYNIMWYFVSKDAYWQRNNSYDYFFEKEVILDDSFFTMWLVQKLNLSEIKIFDSVSYMNQYIDNLEGSLNNNVLYLFVNINKHETNFSSFFGKIRNSVAHGTFNCVNGSFLFIGQNGSKKQGRDDINFLLNISNIDLLKSVFTELNNGINSFSKKFFEQYDKVKTSDGKYYIEDKEIILLDHFVFEKTSKNMGHKDQLIKFLEERNINNSIVIIKDSIAIKYVDEWFANNNVLVVNIKNIYSFLNVNIKIEN